MAGCWPFGRWKLEGVCVRVCCVLWCVCVCVRVCVCACVCGCVLLVRGKGSAGASLLETMAMHMSVNRSPRPFWYMEG